tara:strand:+ start:146 stop:331 length:186 start_codon:yes stop_codon:yes gene_type:complete
MPNNNPSWPLQSEALSQNETLDKVKKIEFSELKYIINNDDNTDNKRGLARDKVFVLGKSDS